MANTGRKGKYSEYAPKIIDLIRDGFNYKESFTKAGVSSSQFYEWKATVPEFAEAIKKAEDERRESMLYDMEASLFRRARGFKATETRTEYNIVDKGKLVETRKTVVEKDVPPDTGAIIFALTNLDPEKWVNRRESGITERDIAEALRQNSEPTKVIFEDYSKKE